MNKRITYGDLKNGMEVFLCGHIFTVSKLETGTTDHDASGNLQKDPVAVVRFTGTCTNDKRNDSIRNTTYDGGRYGGDADGECWINVSKANPTKSPKIRVKRELVKQ